MTVHASESQHWYTRTGAPAYEIKGANGNMRPATLRDARKLGLVPSVTTIIGSCAKPGLERWKLDQMLHSALTLPRLDGEAEAQWIDRVWTDSKETARKAAERGTTIHAGLQDYVSGGTVEPWLAPHVEGVTKAFADSWPSARWDVWIPEQSFAHELGFGGKVDINGNHQVVDFKTKEFGPDSDLKTWDEHAMQLAAYRVGLGMLNARCAICYVSVTNPGLARLIEIPEKELQKGWAMFRGLLDYWKAKNAFDPSWSEEVVTERATAEAQT